MVYGDVRHIPSTFFKSLSIPSISQVKIQKVPTAYGIPPLDFFTPIAQERLYEANLQIKKYFQ